MAWINLLNLGRYHDKIKAWIEENKYIHPLNHPATMIVQDNLNQFVTKNEKTKWNNKMDADANAVSASKLQTPRNINGVSFDGTQDITVPITIHLFESELNKNEKVISIPNMSDNFSNIHKLWLFVDGVKLINNKHYTVNAAENNITLKESYASSTNVEVIFFV